MKHDHTPHLPTGGVTLTNPPRRLRSFGVVGIPNEGATTDLCGRRTDDGMVVAASIDAGEGLGPQLHVSVSYAHRDPRADELFAVQAAFFRDAEITVTQIAPHCFALVSRPRAEDLA